MSYNNVIIPFLSNEKIKEEAEFFRKNFWDGGIPVDIERIIELKLRINIIPIPDFLKLAT